METLVKDFYQKRRWNKDDLEDKLESIESELRNQKVNST